VAVEAWVWAVLRVVVGSAAIGVAGLRMLVVEVRRTGGKHLLHA
jgi:hypothetical protein